MQHWGERSDVGERGDGRHVLYISDGDKHVRYQGNIRDWHFVDIHNIGHICWNAVHFLPVLSPSMLIFKMLQPFESKKITSMQHWGERSDVGERGDGRHVLYISDEFRDKH